NSERLTSGEIIHRRFAFKQPNQPGEYDIDVLSGITFFKDRPSLYELVDIEPRHKDVQLFSGEKRKGPDLLYEFFRGYHGARFRGENRASGGKPCYILSGGYFRGRCGGGRLPGKQLVDQRLGRRFRNEAASHKED